MALRGQFGHHDGFCDVFTLFVGVPSAYAMAFNPGRHTKDILMWMLSTKMLPAAAVLYPMTFLTKNFLNLFDTHFLIILVLSLINLPIVIWMLFTYFKEIPKEIIEAGKMDGVSVWGEIKDIVLPLPGAGCFHRAALFHLLLERSLLDGAPDNDRRRDAVQADRGQPRAGRPVLRPVVGGVDRRCRANRRSRLVLPEAAGARPDIRSCEMTFDAAPTDLSGKTCLVTGANGGIGQATAEHFAALGARVLTTDVGMIRRRLPQRPPCFRSGIG